MSILSLRFGCDAFLFITVCFNNTGITGITGEDCNESLLHFLCKLYSTSVSVNAQRETLHLIKNESEPDSPTAQRWPRATRLIITNNKAIVAKSHGIFRDGQNKQIFQKSKILLEAKISLPASQLRRNTDLNMRALYNA